MDKPRLLVLTGPTAVGKTEIASVVALRLNGEIVSADSMQVYRRMNIGTSKPSGEARSRVLHHLIDVVDPTDVFDAVQYRIKTLGVIEDILSKGCQPIIVGGSGLYIKVLIDGIFAGPSADRLLREKLYHQAAVEGTVSLHERLREVDPRTAERVHPNDLRKIVRALEVYHQSGEPISTLKPSRQSLEDQYEIRMVGLTRSRTELYRHIDQRVDRMFSDGLLEECRQLTELPLSQTARQALGYKEVFEYLEGNISLDEAIRLVKRNSRRYAKRQWTWFRQDPRLKWVQISENDPMEFIVEEVIERFVSSS